MSHDSRPHQPSRPAENGPDAAATRSVAAQTLTQLATPGVDQYALALDLVRRGLDEGTLEKSVSNCHVAGMDSIVLFDDTDTGGGMIRFFFARHGQHRLHQLHDRRGHFTLGVHNHRYPLAIVPLTGTVTNVETQLTDRPTGLVLHQYEFASALADEDTEAIATIHRAVTHVEELHHRDLAPGAAHAMAAADLHTVVVPEELRSPGTAWMVVEGPGEPIASHIYSPRADLRVSSEDLYLPISRRRAVDLTTRVLSLAERG